MVRRVAVVAFLVVLALARSGAAQGPPIDVETLEIEPTVVKTGDPIAQTYRLRFPDLVSEGREIIVLEDRMAPENLPVHPFEAVSLNVVKRRIGDEHIWDFEYGLRLIAPEKAVYVVPSFSFYYLIRDLGEDIEEAEIQQVDGGQGLVRYVSTMTDEPVLDIRDTIGLGEFGGRAVLFSALAWTVAPLPLVVWLVFLVRQWRRREVVPTEVARELEEIERQEALVPAPPSIWEARRTLQGHVQTLQAADANGSLGSLKQDLVISAREYLRAELPELRSGDTPKDMERHIGALGEGGRKTALQTLASRLAVHHAALEQGDGDAGTIANPQEEARLLDDALAALRPHVRLWRAFTGLFEE